MRYVRARARMMMYVRARVRFLGVRDFNGKLVSHDDACACAFISGNSYSSGESGKLSHTPYTHSLSISLRHTHTYRRLKFNWRSKEMKSHY